jgi:hypothetical protein
LKLLALSALAPALHPTLNVFWNGPGAESGTLSKIVAENFFPSTAYSQPDGL